MVTIPLFDRGYAGGNSSSSFESELLINYYRQPGNDKSRLALFPTVGMAAEYFKPGVLRGMHAVGNGQVYYVAGDSVYATGNNGSGAATVAVTGTLATSSGYVSMAHSATQLMIVDGTNGYIVDLATNVLTQIADVDFVAGYTVTYLAGYFIVDNPAGKFRWSNLLDGMTWDSLDFATAESDPDALVAVWAHNGELYLFGTYTTEVWAPSGDTAVFRRVGGAALNFGCVNRWTIAPYKDGLAFIGRTSSRYSVPMILRGYDMREIGTSNIIADLAHYPALPSNVVTAFSYRTNAHTFYQITDTSQNQSWLYDDVTDSWSRVSSLGLTGKHVGIMAAGDDYEQYIGGTDNYMYSIRPTTGVDAHGASTRIPRQIITRHVQKDNSRLRIRELQLDISPGTYSDSFDLFISRDGGHTYEAARNVAYTAGAYSTRVIWRRLGMARDWVFKFQTTGNPIIIGGGITVD